MSELSITMVSGATALAAIAIVALAALRGWGQWVALRRHELDRHAVASGPHDDALPGNTASRIDIADLRERVRKLEAIAAGVDL